MLLMIYGVWLGLHACYELASVCTCLSEWAPSSFSLRMFYIPPLPRVIVLICCATPGRAIYSYVKPSVPNCPSEDVCHFPLPTLPTRLSTS